MKKRKESLLGFGFRTVSVLLLSPVYMCVPIILSGFVCPSVSHSVCRALSASAVSLCLVICQALSAVSLPVSGFISFGRLSELVSRSQTLREKGEGKGRERVC